MAARPTHAGGDRLELLETFIRIADEGGIGAAARALDTTQPTVTRRLQQLELALDARLVERGPQGVGLTPAGASLLPEAREMAARWRGLERIVHAQNAEMAGLVRVVATRELGAALLPSLLSSFSEEHPGVRIDVRFTDGLIDLAGDGVDFWIREGKGGPEGSASKEVGRVRRRLVAAPSLARMLEMERGVAMARCEPLALENAPLIATPQTPRGLCRLTPAAPRGASSTAAGAAAQDARLAPVVTVDHIDVAAELAVAGVGLALLPDWRVRRLVDEGDLAIVAADWTTDDAPISLVWSPTRFRSAPASALFDLVGAELGRSLDGERRAPPRRPSAGLSAALSAVLSGASIDGSARESTDDEDEERL